MSDYLAEAAALLRKAAEENEKKYLTDRTFSSVHAQKTLIEGRERIAMKFAQLGAIEKGLVPRDIADEFLLSARTPESGWSR